jgi:hypothetical protein
MTSEFFLKTFKGQIGIDTTVNELFRGRPTFFGMERIGMETEMMSVCRWDNQMTHMSLLLIAFCSNQFPLRIPEIPWLGSGHAPLELRLCRCLTGIPTSEQVLVSLVRFHEH